MDEAVRFDVLRRYGILEIEPHEPYSGIARIASAVCATPIAAISIIAPSRQWLKSPIGIEKADLSVEDGFAYHTVQNRDIDIINDASRDKELAVNSWVKNEPNIRFYAGVPLIMPNGSTLGALFVADIVPKEISESAISVLKDLASQLVSYIEARARVTELERSISKQRKEEEDLKSQIEQIHSYSRELQVHAVRLEAINARLEALAKLDGMTGLKNHRAFQERLEFEFQRAMRYSMPLSLLLLDVDHFKAFNDTYGHLAGDEVLKTVAQVLQDNARGVDFVARYGGEEFVVILPHADDVAAVSIGERLRAAIANVAWPLRNITASFGVSTLSQIMTHASDLIALSDKALYYSKSAGRNKVTHAKSMGNDVK